MSGHLNDEEWAAAVLNPNDQAVAKHLVECPACRDEVGSFTAAVEAARGQSRKAGELPEAFWRRQQAGISARLANVEFFPPWKRWVWVAATVTMILLACMLLTRNAAPPVQTAVQTDPDDALLLSVQHSIQSDLPQALKPVALLTREMDRATGSRKNP